MTQVTRITKILVNAEGSAYVYIDDTRPGIGCDVSQAIIINKSGAGSNKLYSALLSAYVAQSDVRFSYHTCNSSFAPFMKRIELVRSTPAQ